MNPLLSLIIRYALRAAKYAGVATAAVNAGRLNTPDTAAGPVDYLLYVGLPGLIGPAASCLEWLTGDRSGSLGGRDDPGERLSNEQEQLRQMVIQFMRLGRHDAARRLADLAEKLEQEAIARGPER